MQEFIFDLQRFDYINNYSHFTLVSGTSKNDNIYNYEGRRVTIDGGDGNDYISNREGNNASISGGAGDDTIGNEYGGEKVTIDAGSGNDSIYNDGNNVSISTGDGNDYIYNDSGDKVTIVSGAGNDTIRTYFYSEDEYYDEDSDEPRAVGNNITINPGKGNDFISLHSDNKHLIKYASGDGNDVIYGFNANNTLEIAGSYSSEKSGDDIFLTVGNDEIILIDAAELSKVNIKTSQSSTSNSFKLSGTTATYGTSKKTLFTLSGIKSTSGISVKNKVITISADALNQKKVKLTGSGYTLKLGSDVTKTTSKKSWSLSGTTATYNQASTAGYKLAKDAQSISYTKKATTSLVTITGVKSTKGLSISGDVITVAASSLNKKKVTLTGDGYSLALDDDVTKSSNKKSWSYSNSVATYNQTTSAGYKLAGDGQSISYKKKATTTLATINGAKAKKGLSASGNTIKLKASALSKKVSVSGAFEFEFASDYKNALITGSDSDDTITTAGTNMTINAGSGNDLLTGGKGADVFIYTEGDGNDTITNFDANDKISVKSGVITTSTDGDDVIFKIGSGKITVKDAVNKNISYVDASGREGVYPDVEDSTDVEYNKKGTGATLKSSYSKEKFEPSDYSTYKDILVTIDASAVTNEMSIKGNAKANRITGTEEDDIIYGGKGKDTLLGNDGNDELYGEKGNDSIIGGTGNDTLDGGDGNDILNGGKNNDALWGGVGDDTLTGGAGSDIFYYDDGDGNDIITDYSSSLDKVIILSGLTVGNPDVDNSGNVTFKVGDGQITFQNSENKYIELVNEGGTVQMKYNPN